MKKKRTKVVLIMLFLLLGCSNEKPIDDFDIAVVSTSGSSASSAVTYYDSDLNVIDENTYPYFGMGMIWSSPTYVNKESVFYPINGSIKGGNGKKVVKLNLENGELTEFKIDRTNIQYVDVIDDYIYVTSNHNHVSYLTQYGWVTL